MEIPKIYAEILVCYDVQDDKARKRLADALKDCGLVSIQKSAFWGYATAADRKAIRKAFSSLLDKATDRAFVIPVRLKGREGGEDSFGYAKGDLPDYAEHAVL